MERSAGPPAPGGISIHGPYDTFTRPEPWLMQILLRPAAYRHPRAWGAACSVAGFWLVILGVILSAFRMWWGALLIPVAVLEFWIAYRLLVAPLPQRVRELEQSRARVVDDSAARLRQIERDLHDGAQAQMVAVAMKLSLAVKKLGGMVDGTGQTDLDRVLQLVVAAHRGAKEAITELRDLARGIHPPVLDQGPGIALTSL